MAKTSRKILLIIVLITFSLYFSYLINRIWHYSDKANIAIFTFLFCTLCFIVFKFFKTIKYRSIGSKKIILAFVIATVLSAIIVGTNSDFFFKRITKTTVIISQKEQNSEEAKFIPIKSIIVDNKKQDIKKYEKSNNIKLNFKNCKDILLVFNSDRQSGIITIKDGDRIEEINLYSYNKNVVKYDVKSNKTMDFASLFRMIISFSIIEVLMLMFVLASIYMYKDRKTIILPILFIIAIIQILFYRECLFYKDFNDTIDYFNTNPFSFYLNDRTPVYPIIIKIFTCIFGNPEWYKFVYYMQIIISYISIYFLYKLLKLLIKNEYLVVIAIFMYGISTAVIGWNTDILTESLALSITIFFAYFIINYIKTGMLKYGIVSIILALIITFLKPACIIYPIILFVFFILKLLFNKPKLKNDYKCIFISAITILLIFLYALIFYKQHDIFSISLASVRQDTYVCIHQGFYKNYSDKQVVKEIDKIIQKVDDKWDVMLEVKNKFGDKKCQEIVNELKKNNLKEYIKYYYNTICTYYNTIFNSYYSLCVNEATNLACKLSNSSLFLRFSTVYYLILFEFILFMYKLIRYKKVDWINLGLFGFNFAIVIVTFIGTNSEFMRTAICVVPFSYIALATIVNDFIEVTALKKQK